MAMDGTRDVTDISSQRNGMEGRSCIYALHGYLGREQRLYTVNKTGAEWRKVRFLLRFVLLAIRSMWSVS